MRAPLIALQFLTRLPIRFGKAPSPAEQGAASGWFPLAGLLLGLALMGLGRLFQFDVLLPHQELVLGLILAFWLWAGASLHLDALADSLDGLASGKRGPALLKVLHDPAIGAFGAMGLTLSLILRWGLLYSLAAGWAWWLPLGLMTGRLAQSLLCAFGRYAGGKQGLGAGFVGQSGPAQAWTALAVWLAGFALCAGLGLWLDKVAWWKLGLALLAPTLGLGLGLWAALPLIKRLGGVTGDAIGYASELCELLSLILLAFILG